MTAPLPAGLLAARDHVRKEVERGDGKANFLLSLPSLALAGVVALAGRPMPVPALVAVWVAAVLFLLSVLVLLSAIRPRLNRNPVPGTWLYAAMVGPGELLESYGQTEDAVVTAHDVCVLARIARTKFVCVQRAVVLMVAGLLALSVALTLSVVA